MRRCDRRRVCRRDGTRGPYARADAITGVALQEAGHTGPCRCGTGPDAHHTTKDGKIDRKANLQQVAETEQMSSGLGAAREEIRRLTEELRELERSLGEG